MLVAKTAREVGCGSSLEGSLKIFVLIKRGKVLRLVKAFCCGPGPAAGGEVKGQTHGGVRVQFQQGSGDVGRQGHVVADSTLSRRGTVGVDIEK